MLQELRARGEMNCSQVCECFARSQPTISHHIKTLEAAGLIAVRKEGQFHVLSAVPATLEAFCAELTAAPPAPVAKAAPKPSSRSTGGRASPRKSGARSATGKRSSTAADAAS